MENNYGIGGAGLNTDPGDAFADIPRNRTLMAEQLTHEAPLKPEIVHGLQTLQQVFAHYRPEASIDFKDAAGVTRTETLHFTSLDDFGIQSILAESGFLRDTDAQKNEYLHMIGQLRTNKSLQAAITDPGARQVLLDAIHGMITELKNNP